VALPDGSSIVMPRVWTGRITDLMFEGGLALALMHSSASLGDLSLAHQRGLAVAGRARGERDDVAINRVFYRLEPHLMRRYSALAFDNIRRTPLSFAAACVFRATRLFIVSGSTDVHTAQQFDKSRRIYAPATMAAAFGSLAYITRRLPAGTTSTSKLSALKHRVRNHADFSRRRRHVRTVGEEKLCDQNWKTAMKPTPSVAITKMSGRRPVWSERRSSQGRVSSQDDPM